MPELLRAYGDILRGARDDAFGVLAVLVGAVLLLSATFAVGALSESLVRWWKR